MSEFGFIPKDDTGRPGPTLRTGVDSTLGSSTGLEREPSVFASLWSNIRDVFFPAKLPPLVLESKPIPVVDRMATKQDPKATATAIAIYGVLILLFLWWGARKIKQIQTQKQLELTQVNVPPPMEVKKTTMGGGGGQKGPTPVVKGHLPKFADQQITPPKAPPLEQPKIRMPDATIEVQKDLKMANNNMPNIGMPNSPIVGTGSMGNGNGTGLGNGSGTGLGPGSGGNYGGGLRKIGGGVSMPEVTFKVDPEFSEEARKAKFMGVVTVELIIDTHGLPQNVRLVRGVGMGLDEKAIEAVKQYKFKPAMENGKPVPVKMDIEVNFQIF
ncbi:MAG TPA: energy transducer TonB [Acidobacteriaceae bacterium]|nr:energy transducer TonB [Acidobacteriaceae bacterium]